jgi:hypothetical protein
MMLVLSFSQAGQCDFVAFRAFGSCDVCFNPAPSNGQIMSEGFMTEIQSWFSTMPAITILNPFRTSHSQRKKKMIRYR